MPLPRPPEPTCCAHSASCISSVAFAASLHSQLLYPNTRERFLPGRRAFALGIQIRYFLLPLVSPCASFLRGGLRQPLQKFSQSRKSRAFPAPYCGPCCTAGPKHSFRVINTNPCLFSRPSLLSKCCQTHLYIKWARKLAVFLVRHSPRFV